MDRVVQAFPLGPSRLGNQPSLIVKGCGVATHTRIRTSASFGT